MIAMRAQDLMSHPVFTCHVNDTLNVAAQRMWDHDCGALPVVNDEGILVGMVTDRDICMSAYMRGEALDSLLVNGAMSKHVVAARADEPIADVEEQMAKHKVRRLPVIDREGRPIGIISLNDLALEAAQPDTRLRGGLPKIAHTLAAICHHPQPS